MYSGTGTSSETYSFRILIWNSADNYTGTAVTGWNDAYGTSYTTKPRRPWHTYGNRLAEKALAARRWPCAVAVPPQPPPVPLEKAADELAEETVTTAPSGRPRLRFRLHDRQSVPARTRRKIRTWERTMQRISREGVA